VLHKALLLLAIIAAPALAITQAEHDAIVKDVDSAMQKYVVAPAPVVSWPRTKPDVLDIDFAGFRSLLDAKWQDGNIGYDGAGTAIHYGNMAGPLPITNGVADYSGKFSNPSCPPQFLTDSSLNLHFLRSCTDGTGQVFNGSTCPSCRLTYWDFNGLTPRPEYYVRFMVRVGQITYDNQTDLGIKFPGLAGDQLEIGPKLPVGGNELQTYRYGFESGTGFGVVEKFGFVMMPGRWYTIEEHDRANTFANGAYNKDGLIEVKVDGKLIWVRNNVQQYGPPSIPAVRSLLVQFYHGGLHPPAGRLEIDFARLAICKSDWCGPSIEAAP
jgi:hypothetical protein